MTWTNLKRFYFKGREAIVESRRNIAGFFRGASLETGFIPYFFQLAALQTLDQENLP
ncbi:hypothetical protein TDB9533_01545 [Thalassocella blandensis]|nr:hypothetical protein TDB9533_01545 [Thalassocella blandensis]